MNDGLLTMILIATVVVVVTSLIAKILRIGTDLSNSGYPMRSCCLSGWAQVLESLQESRTGTPASTEKH